MKKLIFGLMLTSQLFFSQDLKVMTYNIRLSLESDKENSWDNRKEDALALMNYYHPDYFGVQEAVPQQMTDIKTTLTDYDYVGVGRDDGKNQGEYSAIFYDKTKLEVTKSGTFWLSETPENLRKVGTLRTTEFVLMRFLKSRKRENNFWR